MFNFENFNELFGGKKAYWEKLKNKILMFDENENLEKAIETAKEAEDAFIRALQIQEAALGSTHPQVLQTMKGLIEVFFKKDLFKKAEPYCERILKINEEIYGPDNPALFEDLSNMGLMYTGISEFEKAEAYLIKAFNLIKDDTELCKARAKTALSNLVSLYRHSENSSEAESAYIKLIELKKQLFGPTHKSVAKSLIDLGFFYNLEDKYYKGEETLMSAIKVYDQNPEAIEEDYATIYELLYDVYSKTGRSDSAKAYGDKATYIRLCNR